MTERQKSQFRPDRESSGHEHFSGVIAEIEARSQHHKDPHAVSIAKTLLAAANDNSWVNRALNSDESKKYSSMELAILLEKVVILHLIGDLWKLAANSDPRFQSALSKTQKKLEEVDWNQTVANIQDQEWQQIIGKRSLQTHLLERYQGVISQVVKPVISENNQTPLTFVDAGASGGLGVWAATEEGLDVKSWLALDCQKPDIPWILTCSVRLSQILSGEYQDYLGKITKLPSSLERMIANMQSIPIKDNSADIYLSIFTWYQQKGYKQALQEARRVVKPTGLIVVTDNLLWKNRQPIFTSPSQNGQLSTIIWTLDQEKNLLGPFKCMTWNSSDCTEGNIGKGLQKVRKTLRGFRS